MCPGFTGGRERETWRWWSGAPMNWGGCQSSVRLVLECVDGSPTDQLDRAECLL